MIHHIVQFALRQRLLVLLLTIFIVIGGAISFHHMPVDAYPDLAPPMVEVITQWPGHAAEEVERLVTIPTEVEMNGVAKMSIMRSISLYGLSDVRMTFDEGTDDYFARQQVFERLSGVTYPSGVTPTLAPLASPSGLVYRYVIDSPDRTKTGSSHANTNRCRELPTILVSAAPSCSIRCFSTRPDSTPITSPCQQCYSSSRSIIPMPGADSIRRAANSITSAVTGSTAIPQTLAT